MSAADGGTAGRARAAPRPAAVRYNDWRQVELPAVGSFAPSLPVSVIVPCFEAPEALALALAGLAGQRFPRDLFEVVVVDDGSEPPIAAPASSPLDVRVVRQERRGFGLARARNTGVRAAAHSVLVFLDGDVIPEAGLLAAHARWHHAVSDALTLGLCAYVSAAGIEAAAVRDRRGSLGELFADRPFDPPWLDRHLARTGDLTSRHDDLFRAVTGHNFGIGRAFYDEVGGFDESFARYGGEDTEFAYRAQVRGGLLVPVRDAFAWHLGRWREGREAKDRSQELQARKLAHLIADPGFRRAVPGQRFAVPRHVVTLEAGGEPVERVVGAAEALLADPEGDLAVRIALPADRAADRARIEEALGPDRRVRVAPEREAPEREALAEFPASPFQLWLPAGAAFAPGLAARLRAALGGAAVARAALSGGGEVVIARAWALHRARRAGGCAADYGDARTLDARVLQGSGRRTSRRRGRRTGWRRRLRSAALARVWEEARHVRGRRTGWRFLRWILGAALWRLRAGPRAWAPAPLPAPAGAPPDPPLEVRVAALGPRARAVFAASSGVAHSATGHVEVVLADSAAEAAGVAAPVVVLGEAPSLAVPAFDAALDNPIGWVRDVEPGAVALGPLRLLPPGVEARRSVPAADRSALRHCHHVEDVGAFHAGPVERAGALARIAARGVPVRLADRDPALEPLLGAELHGLMSTGVRGAGAAAREALSIAMRRAALRTHSLSARTRQVCAAAGAAPPPLPRVSVLLATRRPALLADAVANVARQVYPRIELVLALHGPGFEPDVFEPDLVEDALAGFAPAVKVVRAAEEQVLGAVLNQAVDEASGPLLTKMDDDDVYGPEHLWDLVLAHEYSGAALVGKFPATVYLARLDRTVRCRRVVSETWSRSITGGAMLLARADLERAGGWRRRPRHVDLALIEDVARMGGGVYRTHDAGYLLVRHGDRHTWERGDARFLDGAEAVHDGWKPALAGIGDVPPPGPVRRLPGRPR